MSIEANYRRISPEKFAQLLADRDAAESFFYPSETAWHGEQGSETIQEAKGEVFSLGKEWHALHFLLTGESELTSPSLAIPPLGDVVQGGTPTEFDATYGSVRVLSPDRVRAVADVLQTISAKELERRFDPEKFNALRIYPILQPGGWEEEDIELLLELYPRLVEFFTSASEAGDMVLLSSD